MKSVSTRVDDETHETIAERAETRGSSKAEVLRQLIRDGLRVDDLEAEIERKDARIDRLLQTTQAANRRDDETSELARYVDETRSAGILKRTRWFLFGRDE